jgi:uncharacterized membrane protein
MNFSNILLIATAVTTALIAGLFYAYSCSVNPGLGKLPDAGYLAAMQAINKAIINPLFMFSFLGTVLLLPLSSYLQYGTPRFWFLVAAAGCYVFGTFCVTMFGNVPLNNTLEVLNLEGSSAEALATARARFEKPWNALHTIRTLASFVSLVLVILACLAPAQPAIK